MSPSLFPSILPDPLHLHIPHRYLKSSLTRPEMNELGGSNTSLALTRSLVQIRRISEVSLLFALSCTYTITAFISPYISDRSLARSLHLSHDPPMPFVEVYVDAPLGVVEGRDPKGLYAKVRAGEIKGGSGRVLWSRGFSRY